DLLLAVSCTFHGVLLSQVLGELSFSKWSSFRGLRQGGSRRRTAFSRLKFAGRGRIDMLHKMSQLVSIVLAVVILVLPLSACLTPAAKMSLEERECCQKMAGHCETSVMPSSHSCCQHPVSHQAVIASK